MAPSTPTGPPSQAVAGDSWRWRESDHVDYPQSEGWSLKYELLGDSTLSISPTWQTSGDDINHWLVSEATTDTDALSPGDYRLIGRMVGSGTYSGREETVRESILTVVQDPRTASPGDFQSQEERDLEVVKKAIAGRLTKDLESYSIAGRSISKIPIRDLYSIQSQLEYTIYRRRTGRLGRPVEVRFG